MDVRDITAENIAKAVGGTVERDGSILCCCPVHEASGTHNPSLLLSITDDAPHPVSLPVAELRRQAVPGHPRPPGQKCGLPRSHVGGNRADKEIRYTYQHLDGSYAWTKTRYVTKAGKKRFRCEVWDETTKQWSTGRPDGMPLLFNLAAIASVLAAYPDNSPADRRGREGRHHGGRTRRARHHQRRRRRQVARRRHANTDQTGSAQGRCLPRQRWPRHRARHPRRQDVSAGEHRSALAGAARARPQGRPLGLGAEAGAARRAAQRADRRGTAVRRRGARLAQPPEDGAAQCRLQLSRRHSQHVAGAQIRTAPQGLLCLE